MKPAMQQGWVLGCQGTARAKAKEVTPGKCAIFSMAEDEEERAEVVVMKMEEDGMKEKKVVKEEMEVEKPVGEEVEVTEEHREVEAKGENLRMNRLEAIQREVDAVTDQADRAFLQLERKFGQMRQYYLERRNYLIQNIPDFWFTTLQNHPQLSSLISGQDAEILRYITNLEVKEFRHPRSGCKFKFFFGSNPYFSNRLIVKEYEVRSFGRVVSLSTPIMWLQGQKPPSYICRNQDIICSFFTWFSDHSLPKSDRIAEIIKEELWPNPLQYYLLHEGAHRAGSYPVREPAEIPRPFGFQSG
ncbi:testis-specific Y-encoded-like protein 1 [Dasypus novemcinctus]|uniref:testis-specific Y-encoded-like protein 1 n=1 Tax=Dasypus novemcinctus TaxID=9361 RepID=UPI0039C8FA2F